MIDHGATATWEYWDGERSRVHNCYNGIGTWFYQALGGLRTDSSHPGYEHVFIDPQIPEGSSGAIGKETPTAGSTWLKIATANLTTSPCPRASRPRRSHPPAPAGGGSTAAGWPRNRPGRRSQAAATGCLGLAPAKRAQ